MLSGAVLLLFSSVVPAFASKIGRALTHEEVSVVWMGLSESESYIYRISLSPDGKGLGGYIYGDLEPVLFEIVSWAYTKRRISLSIRFLDGEERNFRPRIRGEIVGSPMTLEVRGSDWRRQVELRREQDYLPSWNKLVEKMAREGSSAP